ncbi:E3 ubiquitin-protein ligase RMA1H1 isoform X3 [Ricinus communis]|nr:E3 ubiquitin-protein ligase RMA1H1 isoform X3 [Ricinus communis]|eukprot:XP_015574646.1 E3 ubiquitin-protein ligase RMA1H1 isoform X3 [Ricinus communis]
MKNERQQGSHYMAGSQRRPVTKSSFTSRSMDFERYFPREWKSIASAATGSESFSGCFDCNICFDFAHEPVVTLCGHLYCWPCIYKWLHVQSASIASDEHPQCPVCKADISHTTMVPLYGRGQAPAEAEIEGKASCRGTAIPPRPSACGAQALISSPQHTAQQLPYHNPYQNHNYTPDPYSSFEEASQSPLLNLGGSAVTGFHHPFVGMFGEMVYARVFGNSDSLYAYRNSYHLMGSNSPRLRRQEMQADKSLNRISIFLFCCFLLCLIVF